MKTGITYCALLALLAVAVPAGFAAEPAVRPEGAPPLVFATPERLAEIRELAGRPGSVHSEILAAMRARIEPGDPLAVEGSYPNYRRSFFAREAAWLYLVTGEEKFAKLAYSALRDVYDSTSPADTARPDGGSGLQRAQTLSAFAMAWNWAWAGWTPEQRAWVEEKIRAGLDDYAKALKHPNIRSPHVSNWNGVVAGGHIIALAASNTWRERRADWESSAKIVAGHIGSLGDRGWLQEGPGYLSLSMENALPAALLLRDLGNPDAAKAVIDRNLHQIFLYAGGFDGGQHALNWGVGAGYFPAGGTTNALLGLVPAADLPFYKWFYDRHRGPANPAPAAKKYDLHGGNGALAMIYYPEQIAARDPGEVFPPAVLDQQGGFLIRNRWRDAGDVIVGLWTDAVAQKNAWDQGDALHLNVLANGVNFGLGPGPVSAPDARTFSSLLVDGKSPPVGGRGKAVSLAAGREGVYAVADGDKAYQALGVKAARHLLVDFNPGGPALVSTLDVLASDAPHLLAWNLYAPGLKLTSGTHDGLPWVQAESPESGAFLRAWAVTPGATARLEKDSMRLEWNAASGQLWVVCEVGKGGSTPSLPVKESANGAESLRIANREIRLVTDKPGLMSPTLADLRPLADPAPKGLSPASGPPPLAVTFSTPPAPAATSWQVDASAPSTNSTHTFDAAGLHSVVATATDPIGVLGRRAMAVLVGSAATDLSIEGLPKNALPDTALQMTAKGVKTPGTAFSWDLGDGTKANGDSVSHAWKAAGTYSVTLTAKTPDGAEAVATARIRIENLAPIARLKADRAGGPAPLTVSFDGSKSADPEGGALTYRWDFGDGSPEKSTDTPQASHVYSAPGIYQATLTVADPNGQSDNAKGPQLRVFSSDEKPLPAAVLPKSAARGLNYAVFQCPVKDGAPPDLLLYSPAREGRVANLEMRVSPFPERYAIAFDGYLHAPQTGIYEFTGTSFGYARVEVGGAPLFRCGKTVIGNNAVLLAEGWHPFRVEVGFETAGQFGTDLPRLNIQWRPPGADEFRPIPDDAFASSHRAERPSIVVSPPEGHDGREFFFEVVSPTGPDLVYRWDFGDGNTAEGRTVRHTYKLSSDNVQTPFVARVQVTRPDGTTATAGKIVLVSRYAGTASSQARRAEGVEELRASTEKQSGWDRRTAPTPFLEMVNRTPGARIEASGEYGAKFAATNLADESYQSRWMSAKGQPEAWVRASFGKPGAPVRHRITNYGFTVGPLRWTWQRDPSAWDIYGSNAPAPPAYSVEPGAKNPGWTRIGSETGLKHAGAEDAGRTRDDAFFFSLDPPEPFAHYLFHFRNQGKELTDTVEITELMLFEPLRAANEAGPASKLEAAPSSGPAPLSATLTIPGAADGIYDWTLGDGHTARTTEPRIVHVYREAGEFKAAVVSRDPATPPLAASASVKVTPGGANRPPEPVVTISETGPVAGKPVRFDASATRDPEGGNVEFVWHFGDGTSASGEVVEHTYHKPGQVDAVLHATDANAAVATWSGRLDVRDAAAGRGVISVNFGGPGSAFGRSIGAGAIPVAGWNHVVDGGRWQDAVGREVPAKIDGEVPGSRGTADIPGGPLDGDRLMLSTGLAPGSRGGWNLTISGIPYARYDVYLYPVPQGERAPAAQGFTIGSRTLYLPGRLSAWGGEHVISRSEKPDDLPANATCLFFEDVSGPSFTISTDKKSGSPRIAGLQIVERADANKSQ